MSVTSSFSYETDSEDYLRFQDGRIEVEEDGSSERGIDLDYPAAINLASALLRWATGLPEEERE